MAEMRLYYFPLHYIGFDVNFLLHFLLQNYNFFFFFKSLIFDEVDLSDASVAETSTKNINNSFTVTMMTHYVYRNHDYSYTVTIMTTITTHFQFYYTLHCKTVGLCKSL